MGAGVLAARLLDAGALRGGVLAVFGRGSTTGGPVTGTLSGAGTLACPACVG